MKRVCQLSLLEAEELTKGYKTGSHHDFRIRCQIILLSGENMSVAQISKRLRKNIKTVYSTLEKYENKSIQGLANKQGQGRISNLDNLSENQIKYVRKVVDKKPQNLNEVVIQLVEKFGFHISKRMLITYLKKKSNILGAEFENG